jgi:hypothetical protein
MAKCTEHVSFPPYPYIENRVLICRPDWPGTLDVDQASPSRSASASRVQGLKVYPTASLIVPFQHSLVVLNKSTFVCVQCPENSRHDTDFCGVCFLRYCLSVAEVCLELASWYRLASNSRSPCLHLLSAGMASVHHPARFESSFGSHTRSGSRGCSSVVESSCLPWPKPWV